MTDNNGFPTLAECIEIAENDPKLSELGDDIKSKIIHDMYEDLRAEVGAGRDIEYKKRAYTDEEMESYNFEV